MKIEKDIDYYSKSHFKKILPYDRKVVYYKKEKKEESTIITIHTGPSLLIYAAFFLPPLNICWPLFGDYSWALMRQTQSNYYFNENGNLINHDGNENYICRRRYFK